MQPTFEAFGVAIFAMVFMQALKKSVPKLVCGVWVKRGIVWALSLVSAVLLNWGAFDWAVIAPQAAVTLLSAEGAYSYFLREKPEVEA